MRTQTLKGQVALVTGASSGVGWQAAVRLAEEGMRLCVTARRADALEALCADLRRRGADAIAIPGDVSNGEEVERIVSGCVAHFGRVDVLVNDAGVQAYGYFDELPWAQVQRIFDVTFFGYLRMARAVLPHFRRQRSGHILNVLSMLSKGAAPLLSVYAAAKHALLGWQDSLRLELQPHGIYVSGVLIPSVSTPMFDHAPTQLGKAPRPVPPTYDTDVAARAVVDCARRPGRNVVPVFLQGHLILWLDRYLPQAGRWLLSRFGVQWQQGPKDIRRPEGNLFQPIAQGVGPYGSVPPTPKWMRYGATAGLLALAAGAAGGAVFGAAQLRRALRAGD